MAETPQDRLIRYIQDAHASEVGIVGTLKTFIAEVDNVQVQAVFQEHLAVTESQAQRLEQRLIALGSGASDGKGFLNTVLGKVANVAQHPFHDEKDKTTQDLIKAYATEHLEIGMYESLYSYAEAIGDTQTAQLAKQIQAEEQDAADKVFPLITLTAKAALANTTAAV